MTRSDRIAPLFVALVGLAEAACTSPDAEVPDRPDLARDAGTDPTAVVDAAGMIDAGADPGVPAQAGALFAFLQQRRYEGFAAESAAHPSSVHTRVRTFVNPTLATSLAQGAVDHPLGAATVKELFDAAGTPRGWAVSVKVARSGDASDWYWYETLDMAWGEDPIEGRGLSACTGCHVSGTDFVFVEYPLP